MVSRLNHRLLGWIWFGIFWRRWLHIFRLEHVDSFAGNTSLLGAFLSISEVYNVSFRSYGVDAGVFFSRRKRGLYAFAHCAQKGEIPGELAGHTLEFGG